MKTANIVSLEDWLSERKSLLEREKEFTRARDKLSTAWRALPWTRTALWSRSIRRTGRCGTPPRSTKARSCSGLRSAGTARGPRRFRQRSVRCMQRRRISAAPTGYRSPVSTRRSNNTHPRRW